LQHFQSGAQTLIEDYVRGQTYGMALLLVKVVSRLLMVIGLYSIAIIAL
jgi:succinate dehydrogenase hydrophobic anchor subunit